MLITITEPVSNFGDTTLQYLQKNILARIFLVIYLEKDLSEKFNFNLGYILKRVLDSDNQDDTLYKASYQKLMDTFWNDDFLTIDSRDKF